MAKKKDTDHEEEEMVIVGPVGEDEDENQSLEFEENDQDDEEERGKKNNSPKDEDGDSDEDDERVGHGEDDEEDDEDGKSKKRDRESRKARRERQKKARQRNETELNFLRHQNEQLEKQVREINQRLARTETGSVDSRIQQIQAQLKVADQVLARAHEGGSGEDVVEATNIRDKLRDSLGRLNEYKTLMLRKQQEDEPTVDSRLVRHAQNWMSDHDWYDPQGSDKDSRAVSAIDDRLVQEGYNPNTQEYWDELTRRVRRRLPHRFRDTDSDDDFEDDEDEPRSRRGKSKGGGPRFSTGGRERPLRRNEVYISPERKQAMIDAGVWDDPVLRQRYLKTYARYDRENRRGQR